jgi:hypothetical protein
MKIAKMVAFVLYYTQSFHDVVVQQCTRPHLAFGKNSEYAAKTIFPLHLYNACQTPLMLKDRRS